MALLQTLAVEITRVLNEQVILQHLLAHRTRDETLVGIRVHLNKSGFFASDRLKLSQDSLLLPTADGQEPRNGSSRPLPRICLFITLR